MFNEITSYIDLAQVTLYAFWIFFAGLIFWLRMEDRREGYPLESDSPIRIGHRNSLLIPAPKLFYRPEGDTYAAPNFDRDMREIPGTRTSGLPGMPLEPVGNAMLANVGPSSWAQRHDAPELTREGHHAVVPMRVATEYRVNAGPDPRGWDVVGGDGAVAGRVKEIWLDRADMLVRYLEVELAGSETETRLVPMPMIVVDPSQKRIEVSSILASQFADVPRLAQPDQITLLEEERVSAYYAGGLLYAEPKRLGPIV